MNSAADGIGFTPALEEYHTFEKVSELDSVSLILSDKDSFDMVIYENNKFKSTT
jgi:hypothetical protein